jgi:hypothetical protein
MDWPCEHCDAPDTSLLRVVLIGEILRAEEVTLNILVEVCDALGLIDFSPEDGDFPPPVEPRKRKNSTLRRVK